MKHLKRFNESNDSKISQFTQEFKRLVNNDEYEQGDEPSMTDILSEVGDLCNKYNMTSDDLKEVIDNGDDENNIITILHDETLQSEAESGDYLNKESDLENKIRDIIQGELYLRDVPYSMEEGAQEVDPDSLDDAAKAVINLLKKEGYIK
jgi:hypothetical protein